MPIFSKFGCNAAECHGSATGRGDFKLSLFGGDPKLDYDAIVFRLGGRRINQLRPEKSLLLSKPTEVLAHEGGERFEADSLPAKRIVEWIKSGARLESKVRISAVRAKQNRFKAGAENNIFQLQIVASTDKGDKDVTQNSTFVSSNPSAVTVDKSGRFEVHKPGKHFVVAKYLQHAITVEVFQPFASDNWTKNRSRNQLVDQTISKSLDELHISFPPAASESTFIRRLYLDLTGRLPSPSEVNAYLKSTVPDKKEKLVDRLLESKQFHQYWSFWLRNLIQFRKPGKETKAASILNEWIIRSVQTDARWSDTVGQLITTVGDSEKNPPANFHRFFADARGEAEVVANSFLGFRIGCANCHNHPLDRWTQEDYHGLAAIFATLKRGKTVTHFPDGTVIQPKTGKPAIPRIPGEFDLNGSTDKREDLIKWMTTSDLFKQSIVNRVWKHFLGKGIVEPVDDFRLSNPPNDVQLLKLLADYFEVNEFRFRSLIKLIVLSDVYASVPADEGHREFWPAYHAKPLSPEVYYDICQQVIFDENDKESGATGSATNSLILASADKALRLLKGCDPRDDCIVGQVENASMGLREKLHLINGSLLNRWLQRPSNLLNKWVEEDKDLLSTVSRFYRRGLSRTMTDHERKFWNAQIQIHLKPEEKVGKTERLQFLEDALWSVINSREFRTIQ